MSKKLFLFLIFLMPISLHSSFGDMLTSKNIVGMTSVALGIRFFTYALKKYSKLELVIIAEMYAKHLSNNAFERANLTKDILPEWYNTEEDRQEVAIARRDGRILLVSSLCCFGIATWNYGLR